VSDEPPAERKEVKVDPKVYDNLVGKYQLAPGAVFIVKRVGDKLMVQLTGQPFFEVFPQSETEYFYKVVDAQLTFVKGADARAGALVLHQNGIDQRAERVAE
jgi:hypothetical protein